MSGLRVTVVGGGIGGAAAALALIRAGCDVHVYEQVASKTEVGAGIAQAIEDGATLAASLAGIAPSGVIEPLARYEELRRPRTAAIQLAARGNAVTFHLPDGAEQQKRDTEMGTRTGLSPKRAAIFGFDAERLQAAPQS